MDEDEEMAELRAQEARRVREEAKKCLRHASFQLGKAAYEIDEYLKEFSTARTVATEAGFGRIAHEAGSASNFITIALEHDSFNSLLRRG